MVERLHGTIRQRNKVMRGLDDEETAQTLMDGMRLCYNFLRPHSASNGKTPAQKAKIGFDPEPLTEKSSTNPTHNKVTANPYWFFINDLC